MEIKNWKLEISGDTLLLDKPKSITSFDCIRILRKKLGIRKMGHAGTLDPMASGLMIIGVNEGTKKMSEFLKLPKVYIADVLLGKKTDTGDMEGRVIEETDVPEISEEKIREVVAGMVGKHLLPVPMYSAIKIGGRPLYKLARKKEKGKELTVAEENITPPVKEMEVLSARLLEIHCQGSTLTMKIEMEVSSGTYVRTLGEELGRRLGFPATLAALRRTKIGEFSVEDAMPLEK
ncbi:MAG: tRNA pseudouridine(55) synthase TruB [Parcubacteria group bacterium]|nr:tRNA pseudouridine(55) synthase TruB [Parcubacteria group bacterium]